MQDKWIGVGGKFEDKESPEDCLFREVREETGLTLTSWKFRGIITFVTDRYETEFMHLYTADDWEGEMIECNEGNLEWLDKKEVFNLKVWEGDKIFFWLMQHDAPFFSLRLEYVGDELVSYSLNGIYHRQKAEGQSMYQEFLDTYRSQYIVFEITTPFASYAIGIVIYETMYWNSTMYKMGRINHRHNQIFFV